ILCHLSVAPLDPAFPPLLSSSSLSLVLFTPPATSQIYTLSLHDALPISHCPPGEARLAQDLCCYSSNGPVRGRHSPTRDLGQGRSEEHTSELQSRFDLVCRLLLEKKKKKIADSHSRKLHTDERWYTTEVL